MTDLKDMTERQKRTVRIKVARDVLKQIRANFYHPRYGTYAVLELDSDKTEWDETLDHRKELKAQLRKVEFCVVCGIGATFMSLVRLYNHYKPTRCEARHGGLCDDRMRVALKQVFSREQIALIETAFEGMQIDSVRINPALRRRAVLFRGSLEGMSLERPEAVLRRIMRNIIRNRGTFVP